MREHRPVLASRPIGSPHWHLCACLCGWARIRAAMSAETDDPFAIRSRSQPPYLGVITGDAQRGD